MNKQLYQGKFIAFEGLDGSGKSTQTKMLVDYLKKQGYQVAQIDFPRHGEKAAALVDSYLLGQYGAAAKVNPYAASIFYACDRYDASFQIRRWLREHRVVIADRYVASNVGHQGGKIKDEVAWKKYVDWLYNLEYKIFSIPKPIISIILKTNVAFSQNLSSKITNEEKKARRQTYLGSERYDIHEKDSQHLENALNSFLKAAEEFPEDFVVIECIQDGKLLSSEIVHQKVIEIIKRIL